MIPEHNDQHHDTPKRFNIGYFCRETAELFYEGWRKSSLHMKEYRRLEEAKQSRKYIVELLEEDLYDKVSRGTAEQKLEALKYFQRKKEAEQHAESRPYTWGEQLSSLAFNAAYLGVCITLVSFAANWSCGSSQSQACKDIRATTSSIVHYWISPQKPIESELLK